jgi:ATP-binding cassette subfamily G (WHITE) protein 2
MNDLIKCFLIGPTGCGKSTLLDILADRKDSHGLSGSVFVSGQIRPTYFKYVIGYVIQDGRKCLIFFLFIFV